MTEELALTLLRTWAYEEIGKMDFSKFQENGEIMY